MLHIAILSVTDENLYTERRSNTEVLTLYTNIKFIVGGLYKS